MLKAEPLIMKIEPKSQYRSVSSSFHSLEDSAVHGSIERHTTIYCEISRGYTIEKDLENRRVATARAQILWRVEKRKCHEGTTTVRREGGLYATPCLVVVPDPSLERGRETCAVH